MAKGDPRCGMRWQHVKASSNRERLRRELRVDQLQLGQRVPKNVEAACVLGVTDKRAGMHLQALLAELHIAWDTRYVKGRGGRHRVVVEAPIPGLFS